MLVAAIRSSGLKQWRIAELVGWPEWRLSKIVRRGGATADERARLSDLFGVSEAVLFGVGLAVTVKLAPEPAREVAKKSKRSTGT
jgi:hypothetical protein